MKKISALFVILVAIVIVALNAQNYLKTRSKTPIATINNHIFKLEVAKTPKEQEIGLSAKKMLDQNSGMLFRFEKPGYYSFWMKSMKFPIDIIYIRNGRIVTIHKNVNPPKSPNEHLPIYNPSEPTDTVLEINAGLAQKYNIKEEDIVKIEDL